MAHARRLAAILVLIVVVAVLVVSERVHEALIGLLAAAQEIAAEHPGAAAGLVVLFAALAAMTAFVSSWIVLPFAVYTWGTAAALLLLWCGWLLGGVAAYAIGRFVGRPAVGWLTARDVLARYEERISHRSAFGLVLLLQLGLPSEIPGYLLGIVRYPFAWYLAALGIAELVHGIPTVLLGTGLVQRRTFLVVAVAIVLGALTLGAAYTLRRRFAQANHTAPKSPAAPTPVDA